MLESRVRSPLVPLGLFRLRNLATSNVVGVLWAAAMFAWFFLSALYLQLVLGYSPLEVGLAFLPGNLIMAVLSLGLSAKLVMRFGIKAPLSIGLTLASIGLLLLARAPVGGHYVVDVLPSMMLLGFGAGTALNPVLLAAMGDVEQSDAGLASGVVNTSFMMGGALGLAVLASVAASRTLAAAGCGPQPRQRADRRLSRRFPDRRRVRAHRGRARRDAAPRAGRGARGGARRSRPRPGRRGRGIELIAIGRIGWPAASEHVADRRIRLSGGTCPISRNPLHCPRQPIAVAAQSDRRRATYAVILGRGP